MIGVTLGLNKIQLALLSVYLVVAVDMFGLTLVIPVTVTYCEYLGADKSKIGLLYSAYSIGALLSSLVIGRISDVFGRRNVFLWTLSGAFLAFLGSGYARSFTEFALWRGLAGIFTGTIANAFAYISDVVPPSLAPIYISYVTALISSCFVLGPMIGGGLASFGIRVPFFCASFIAWIGLLMVYFYVHNPEEIKENLNTISLSQKINQNDSPRKESSDEYYYQAKNREEDEEEERIRLLSRELIVTKANEESSNREENRLPVGNEPSTKLQMRQEENEEKGKQHQEDRKDISPFLHPGAIMVGGIGTLLNTFTYTALAILVPLFLMEPSYGIVPQIPSLSPLLPTGDLQEHLTTQQSEKISLFVGYNLGIFGFIQAACMIYLFPLFNQYFGLLSTGSFGAFIVGSFFLFFLLAKNESNLIWIYIGLAIGNGLVRPCLPAYLGQIASKRRHGEYLALSSTFSNIAMLFSGYISEIYYKDSKWDAILLAAGCSLLNGFILLLYQIITTYYCAAASAARKKRQENEKKNNHQQFLQRRNQLEQFFGIGEE